MLITIKTEFYFNSLLICIASNIFNTAMSSAQEQNRHVCVCENGRTYPSIASLKQHQRYYCREFARKQNQQQNVNVQEQHTNLTDDTVCPICKNKYSSYAGVRQHMRTQHVAEYNADLENEANKTSRSKMWNEREIKHMALLEMQYSGNKLNSFLSKELKRSVESIKGKRKQTSYKELIAAMKAERNTQETEQETQQTNTNKVTPLQINKDIQQQESSNQISNEIIEMALVTDAVAQTTTNFVYKENTQEDNRSDATTNVIDIKNGQEENQINQIEIIVQQKDQPEIILDREITTVNENESENISENLSLNLNSNLNLNLNLNLDLNNELVIDRVAMHLGQLDDERIATILKDDFESRNVLKQIVQEIIDKYGKKTKINVNGNKREEINKQIGTSRNKRRAYEYKMAQKQFTKNRKNYARSLIDGKISQEQEICPDKENIKKAYRRIFETVSLDDCSIPPSEEQNLIDLYRPVLKDDIKWAFKVTKKDTASGLDGISLKSMKQIPSKTLELIFNAMLFLKFVPEILLKARTTLIPKKQTELDNVDNWRPITVSSLLLRMLNKIIAKRLGEININQMQRGFTNIDGCFANTLTLQTVIKHRREKGRPYVLISLDVQKAFDTVSHGSIKRALRRLNVDDNTIKYIMANYNEASISISCNGQIAGDISIKRGVKQGDPMSPLLFNAVLDELIERLDKLQGIKIGDSRISCMAYADDLILMSTNKEEADEALKICCNFFKEKGMNLNAAKCRSIVAKTVPAKKKLYVRTESDFEIYGTNISPCGPEEYLKYLGQRFSPNGVENCGVGEIFEQVQRIRKAPLKPSQKLFILKQFLIPRYIAQYQSFKINLTILKKADKIIRFGIRKILHLTAHCTNAFIHTPMRGGGLGIFSFTQSIPILLNQRYSNLKGKSKTLDEILKKSEKWIESIQKMIKQGKNSRELIIKFNTDQLQESFSGNGICQVKYLTESSSYIDNPPTYWKGEEYIKAINLRGNLLPTKSMPSVPINERKCRAGCFRNETLCHVLQRCPVTHWKRIQRHDYICKRIATAAEKDGYQYQAEPRIRLPNGELKKPDMILIKGDKVIVSEVGCHWEGPESLQAAYKNKLALYSTDLCIEAYKRKFPNKTVYVLPFIMGARGAWCYANKFLAQHLHMTSATKKDIVHTTLRGSWTIHDNFMRTIWARA